MSKDIAGVKTGIELIAEERLRQVEVEGWTPEHDMEHVYGELAIAAACYSVNKLPKIKVQVYLEAESSFLSGNTGDRGDRQLRKAGWYDAWPWEENWDKRERHDRRKSLIAAGALIAAEIDRLQKLKNNGK